MGKKQKRKMKKGNIAPLYAIPTFSQLSKMKIDDPETISVFRNLELRYTKAELHDEYNGKISIPVIQKLFFYKNFPPFNRVSNSHVKNEFERQVDFAIINKIDNKVITKRIRQMVSDYETPYILNAFGITESEWTFYRSLMDVQTKDTCTRFKTPTDPYDICLIQKTDKCFDTFVKFRKAETAIPTNTGKDTKPMALEYLVNNSTGLVKINSVKEVGSNTTPTVQPAKLSTEPPIMSLLDFFKLSRAEGTEILKYYIDNQYSNIEIEKRLGISSLNIFRKLRCMYLITEGVKYWGFRGFSTAFLTDLATAATTYEAAQEFLEALRLSGNFTKQYGIPKDKFERFITHYFGIRKNSKGRWVVEEWDYYVQKATAMTVAAQKTGSKTTNLTDTEVKIYELANKPEIPDKELIGILRKVVVVAGARKQPYISVQQIQSDIALEPYNTVSIDKIKDFLNKMIANEAFKNCPFKLVAETVASTMLSAASCIRWNFEFTTKDTVTPPAPTSAVSPVKPIPESVMTTAKETMHNTKEVEKTKATTITPPPIKPVDTVVVEKTITEPVSTPTVIESKESSTIPSSIVKEEKQAIKAPPVVETNPVDDPTKVTTINKGHGSKPLYVVNASKLRANERVVGLNIGETFKDIISSTTMDFEVKRNMTDIPEMLQTILQTLCITKGKKLHVSISINTVEETENK